MPWGPVKVPNRNQTYEMNWSFSEIGDRELDSTNQPENTEWLQAGETGCSELVATVCLAPGTGSEILLLVGIKGPFQTV